MVGQEDGGGQTSGHSATNIGDGNAPPAGYPLQVAHNEDLEEHGDQQREDPVWRRGTLSKTSGRVVICQGNTSRGEQSKNIFNFKCCMYMHIKLFQTVRYFLMHSQCKFAAPH